MNLLPRENISFLSKHSPKILLNRLEENLDTPPAIRIFEVFRKRRGKIYTGTAGDNSFQINRIIFYPNSFQPQIYGKISENTDGAKIDLEIKTSNFRELSYMIGNILFSVIFVLMLLISLFQWKMNSYILIPISMLVFNYVITMGIFRYESKKGKDYLYKLFEFETLL